MRLAESGGTCSGVEDLGVLAEAVVVVLEIDGRERLMTGVEKRRERRGREGRQGAGCGGREDSGHEHIAVRC